MVIYNLIISYLVTSLSWDSYFLIEFRTRLFESQNVFSSRYLFFFNELNNSGGSSDQFRRYCLFPSRPTKIKSMFVFYCCSSAVVSIFPHYSP